MPLERKPAASEGQPEYPDSAEYSADRRGFLAMIGVVAAGAAGYFAYKSFTAQPKAVPMGGVCPVAPANAPTPAPTTPTNVNAPVPATPAAAAQGNVAMPIAPAQPESQAEGGLRKIDAPPPPAEPQAQPLGDTKAPEIRPAADPKANIRGGSGMLKKRSDRRQA